MRRAQGIGINVVIVAAIALIVLVIIAILVMNGGIKLNKATSGCVSRGGQCIGYGEQPPSDLNWQQSYNLEHTCPTQGDTCYIYMMQ